MVLNDIRSDIRMMCNVRGECPTEVGYSMGHPKSFMGKVYKSGALSKEYITACEDAGYDIRIAYDPSVPYLERMNNDAEKDLKRLSGRAQELKKPAVNQRFCDVCRYLGFGITLTYEKRAERP